MKIAILSDIHGNYIALQSCIEHAFAQGVDAFAFLGDYLGEFPSTQKTLEILYELKSKRKCYFIRGNKEDYWINRRNDVNCDWKNGNHSIMAMISNYENLKPSDIDFFESLPISISLGFEGIEAVLLCHGTPFANNRKLLAEDIEVMDAIGTCAEKYIVCGHTHIQGVICKGEKTVLNAGAVGVPMYAPGKAQYMILSGGENGWDYEFFSVEYDVERTIAELKESELWKKSPYWCRITEHLLKTGEVAHGDVLNLVRKIYDGDSAWYDIDESYWEQALKMLGVM